MRAYTPQLEQRLWYRVLEGQSRADIITSGYHQRNVDRFFEDWGWKIEQVRAKQQKIEEEVEQEIEIRAKDYLSPQSGDKIINCPECENEVKLSRLQSHFDKEHIASRVKPESAGFLPDWYKEHVRKEKWRQFISNKILYTPMGN